MTSSCAELLGIQFGIPKSWPKVRQGAASGFVGVVNVVLCLVGRPAVFQTDIAIELNI